MADEPEKKTDEPENHTIRLLKEMRADMNRRFDAIDGRLGALERRMDASEGRDAAFAKAIQDLTENAKTVIDGVTALAKGVEILREGQGNIEHDLRGIKMRIERIEKHTGLVQA
jgi:chromosome segregation ATPase